MKYLITGGNGFIGSNLIEALEKNDEKDIELMNSDISLGFVPNEKPDVIIHLAANTNTVYPDDEDMYRNNIIGFLNVLRYSVKNNIRLIYASSGAIYGNNGEPLNAYGESKWICDKLAERYLKKNQIVGLRFFNVYGNLERKKGSMASMITQWRDQIAAGKRPIIFDGDFKRDFVYVKDIVKAILISRSLESGIYDVGNGKSTDFKDVLATIIRTMNVDVSPVFVENPYIDKYQTNTVADIKSWNFKPDYTVEEGIKDYIENYE